MHGPFRQLASNKYNPDPTKVVKWGDQTWEEMMIGWLGYYNTASDLKPADKPATTSSSGAQR